MRTFKELFEEEIEEKSNACSDYDASQKDG